MGQMAVSGGGGFLLLLFVVVLLPRSATVLLADAARRALTDVSSPPAPSPAADAPILPDVVVSPPTAVKIPTEGDNHYQKQVLVAVILSLVVVIVMAVSATYAWSFWRKAREALDYKDMKLPNRSNGHMLLPVLGKLNSNKMSNKEVIAVMDFSVLETATGKFSEENILGKGGFGCVYRACLDGDVVAAVKKLNCCRQEVEKEFEISDFGLATYGGNHNRDDINPSGTVGYVAPEYLLDVVLLELLLGRKPVERVGESHCESIVSWAMPQITDRTKLPQIIDPVIQNTMDLKHLYQVAAVAVLCVQPEPSYRPLIADVLHSLVPLVPVELGGRG
ncbi:hypothetical protein ACQ4PT_018033 [Festuca glaucescens]